MNWEMGQDWSLEGIIACHYSDIFLCIHHKNENIYSNFYCNYWCALLCSFTNLMNRQISHNTKNDTTCTSFLESCKHKCKTNYCHVAISFTLLCCYFVAFTEYIFETREIQYTIISETCEVYIIIVITLWGAFLTILRHFSKYLRSKIVWTNFHM